MMGFKPRDLFLVPFAAVLVGCGTAHVAGSAAKLPMTEAQVRNKAMVEKYLSAQSPAAALSCLASSNHPRMLEWDTALNPRREVFTLAVNEREAIVVMHEDNDFSRLIDHPGWSGTITYFFNDQGLIERGSFTPAPDGVGWRAYLEPALPWLQEHHPDELASVLPDGKLKQDAQSARTWVQILREWRAATGRPAI